jgi:hypothetical protein
MPPKKRKGDFPATQTVESAQKSLRNSDPSRSMLNIETDDDDESDLATMRAKYNESQAKLAAALLKNERLEAAASEPCARCHYYSDWTVRVRTMSGQVHTIACPDGPKTLVAHVKQKLAQFDPKCHILQQVTLVLPCEASSSSSSSSSADPTDPALADDQTLASCGLSKRDVVDLLLVDMNWSDECREIVEFIKDGGEELNFATVVDDDKALAISWALVNAVCLSLRPSLSIVGDINFAALSL